MPHSIEVQFSQIKANYVPIQFRGQVKYFQENQDVPLFIEEFRCSLIPPPFIPDDMIVYSKDRAVAIHPLQITCDIFLDGSLSSNFVFRYSNDPPLYATPNEYFQQAILRASFQRYKTSQYYEDAQLVKNDDKDFIIGDLRLKISTLGSGSYFIQVQRALLTDQFGDTQIILPFLSDGVKLAALKRGLDIKNGYIDTELASSMGELIKGELLDTFEPGFIKNFTESLNQKSNTLLGYIDDLLHKNTVFEYPDLVPRVNYLKLLNEQPTILESIRDVVLYIGNQTGAFQSYDSDTSQLGLVQLAKFAATDTLNANIQAAEVLLRWGINIQDYLNDNTRSTISHISDLLSAQTISDIFAVQNALFNARFLTKPLSALMFDPSKVVKLKAAKDMGLYFLTKASIFGLAERFGPSILDKGFRQTGTQLARITDDYPSINQFVYDTYETKYVQTLIKTLGFIGTAAALHSLKYLGYMNAGYHRDFNMIAQNQFIRRYGPEIGQYVLSLTQKDMSNTLLPIDIALHSAGFNANTAQQYHIHDYDNFKKYLTKVIKGGEKVKYLNKPLYDLTMNDIVQEYIKKYQNKLPYREANPQFAIQKSYKLLLGDQKAFDKKLGWHLKEYMERVQKQDRELFDEFRSDNLFPEPKQILSNLKAQAPSLISLVSNYGPKLLMSTILGLSGIGVVDYFRLRDKKLSEKEVRAKQLIIKSDKIPLVGISTQMPKLQTLNNFYYNQTQMDQDPPNSIEEIVNRNVTQEEQIDTSTKKSLLEKLSSSIGSGLAGLGLGAYYHRNKSPKQEAEEVKRQIKDQQILQTLQEAERQAGIPIKTNTLRLQKRNRVTLNAFLFKDFLQKATDILEEEELLTPYAKEHRRKLLERKRYLNLGYKRPKH